ncbi:20417_t:CDS:2 [Entrophospora sp. SA101]|nr:20417_t:CDS:2 [Entrophospora sp. SA101]
MKKIRDHLLHPIPVLVGGPGTGKSRILQELPALLHNHAQQYSDDNELKNAICENKMFAINVTFGNGSNVDIRDTEIGGQASVGLRILYEHFIYGIVVFGIDELNALHQADQSPEKILVRSIVRAVGGLSCSSMERFYVPILSGTIQGPLETFVRESTYLFLHLPLRLLNNDEMFEIGVKIAEFEPLMTKYISNNTFSRCISDIGVFGIDELNALHQADQSPEKILVRSIVRAVGGLSCSSMERFYVPILSGTIQGPLETFVRESTYLFLHLPLRLLNNDEMFEIGVKIAEFEPLMTKYISNNTFSRCISDIGGQVRALEIFYEKLLNKLKQPSYVDYVEVFHEVKSELLSRYPFQDFAVDATPMMAHAILNIPVESTDVINIGKSQITYLDLASLGILNLEKTTGNKFYICMPYLWVWILTSLNSTCRFWKVMIQQNSHVFWETFEEFNAQFWALRLCLFSVLNKKITLKDLFGGANNVGDISETVIDLVDQSTVNIQSLDYRYPGPKDTDLHKNFGTVYWNGDGAEWDVFFFLKSWIIITQAKSSDPTAKQPQTVNRKMLDKEYDKYLEGIKKMNNLIGKNSSITNSALLLSTNGRSTSNLLSQPVEHNNYFVVNCNNFRDFYGYTFASRAEFAAANDQIDINSAQEFEIRTIRGIGAEIAKMICKKRKERPFDDIEDLLSRVPIKGRAALKKNKNRKSD